MRSWVSAVLVGIIVGSAATVSAASRKHRDSFDDLFAAVDVASKHHKSSHSPHHAKARHATRSEPLRPKETRVAAAEVPAPAANPDALVLSDYAPNRHAWVGP